LYFTISLHQKSVLIRGVVSLEGGGGSLLSLYFTISLHQKYGLINKDGVVFGGSGLIRGGILYSPRNENLNLMARIKFLNLLLYSSI
jgi:hypothetical protein